MNRNKVGKWSRWVVWGVAAAVLSLGCSPLSVFSFLLSPDAEKVPAKYPLTFAKDSPKKDKDEVVILILPHILPGTNRDFATADRELADKLSRVLPDLAKDNKDKRKFRVISPTQVDKFKMTNPHWKQMTASEIGVKLEADFVLEIELSQMRLYQPNTGAYDKIYEGHAEVQVNVYEIGTTKGELKDSYPMSFSYPRGMVRSASAVGEREFRQQYMDNLAFDIAQMHIDHKTSNTIANGK